MRRTWFKDKNRPGYFRNVPLILDERRKFWNIQLPWRRRALEQDSAEAWREGLMERDEIGPRDRVIHVDVSVPIVTYDGRVI